MDQSTWQTVISFDLLHSSSEYKQYCRDGNTAKQCRFGLFQDSDLAGDLEDSKSTSGGTLCIFGSHTFVPFCWMCQKQTSVSHSSTESEIISLDAGFRMDVTPALDLWDLIVAVHGNTYRSNQGRGDLCTNLVRSTPHTIQKRKKSHGMIDDLTMLILFSSNVHSSRQKALLYILEDNEAVIKMIIKERSFTIRHVSRIHGVALDWLFDRINLDAKNPHQVHRHQKPTRRHTDKGKFHTWWMGIIFCVCSTLAISMSKRTQKDAGEERAKSRPILNLVSLCSVRKPNVFASIASESPEKTRYESQIPLSSWTEQHLRTGDL